MEIYTIGYSGFEINDFINMLQTNNINSLIDVRSSPYSKIYTDYNREELQKRLKENGIVYRNYIKEFGARQKEIKYYPNGYLDFSLFTKSEAFQSGMDKISKAIPMGFSFVLMCSEKDPITCHRSIMIAREFHRNGFAVKHILSDGRISSQEEIERRLVDMYYPDRDQVSLFDSPLPWETMVKNSYEFQNKKIGYKLESIEGENDFNE